jgi:hypothetical protein
LLEATEDGVHYLGEEAAVENLELTVCHVWGSCFAVMNIGIFDAVVEPIELGDLPGWDGCRAGVDVCHDLQAEDVAD